MAAVSSTLRTLGEQGLIDLIQAQVSKCDASVLVGIGDDCALVQPAAGKALAITADHLVEGVHFLREDISPEDLGWKSLAVNLSDLAAKGATPRWVTLSLALPGNVDQVWVTQFMNGFRSLAEKYAVTLIGGDSTKSERDIFISLTLVGEVEPNKCALRSAARVGDIVCVTRQLGDSAAGLKIILDKLPRLTDEAKYLLKKHYVPEPEIKAGLFLSAQKGVHAMMDLSDGLALDLPKLLKASSLSAEIELEKLPTSQFFEGFCHRYQVGKEELALTGGEDYCLLCTVDETSLGEINAQLKSAADTVLYPIGRVRNDAAVGTFCLLRNKKEVSLSLNPFEHF